MRAITLQQPWAYAIVHLGKDVENRTWRTGYEPIQIAVHAGKSYDWHGEDFIARLGLAVPSKMPTGAIVGLITVLGAHKNHADWCSPWAIPDQWHWQLSEPIRVEPVPCRGAQGLWTVPAEVEALVLSQLVDAGRAPEAGDPA